MVKFMRISEKDGLGKWQKLITQNQLKKILKKLLI